MFLNKKLGIINCGVGNFRSLTNALSHISDCELVVSNEYSRLRECHRLFIPGVGSFATASQHNNLNTLDLLIKEFSNAGKPVLGICLGMQLLFDSSNEGGEEHSGLKLVNAPIKHFTSHKDYREDDNLLIPHVGFNSVILSTNSPLFKNIDHNSRFYFTHSYFAPSNTISTLATSTYGKCCFTSAIQLNNTYAVQFHPELSGKVGLKMLKNFLSL